MRTVCSASALVAALALGVGAAAQADGGTVQAAAAGPGKTRLSFARTPSRPASLVVSRDAVVPAAAQPQAAAIVGRVGDDVVIVTDDYRSRLNLGGGQCGAGEERFLRVIRLAPKPAQETYRVKLASCWDDIELQS